MGLVCGFVLTQQQAAAAATNTPDPTATSMVAPRSTATAKPAEPNQNEQPVNQQTSTQKAVTSTDTVNETVNQDQTSRTQSTVSPATNTSTELTNSSNNQTTSAQPQQETATQNTAAHSSTNSANEATKHVNQPTAPATSQATKATNSANTASTTTDPQVETIAQGTWGTSKWEYTHQGDDYILHFHEGTFGNSSQKTIKDPDGYPQYFLGSIGASPEIFNGNKRWSDALTQIIIDPGVIANRDSSYLFGYLKNLKKIVGLANLDTTNVNNMAGMFEGCLKLTSLDVSNFDTSKVTDMSCMFRSCHNLTSLDVSNFNTANVTDMSWMFVDCYNLTNLNLSHFNTTNVIDMSWMFGSCWRLINLDLSKFNTANVTDMERMFFGCSGLTSLDLNNFNTTNVTDMRQMFYWCDNLTSLNLSDWNNGNVTDMGHMFEFCYDLTSLNLSNFNTANVTDMSEMFHGCSGLTSLNLSSFNTTKVTDMESMFNECSSLTSLDLNNFNTVNVRYMRYMFGSCRGLTSLDLSSFDTSKIVDMDSIFYDCLNLNHLILGPQTECKYVYLPKVPNTGTRVPGTDRVVTSPYWVATSGYQQGHKYTSNDLMELTGRDQVTTYDWDSKPAFTQTTETKAVTRAIRIHQLDGNTKTEIQSVMISRPVTLNADGSKTYGAWSTAQWDAYAIPEIAGYTASVNQIPAQTVDSNTTNQTIDVYYEPQEQTVEIQYLDHGQIVGTQKITGYTGDTIMPNYHAPQGYEITSITPATITIDGSGKQIVQVNVSHKQETSVEYKTVIRTINLHQINGQMKTYKQMVLLQRGVQMDAVTGNKTYGQWNTGYWDAFNIPVIDGYTASQDQVAAQLVTNQDSDQTVDVYYTPKN